MNCVDAAEFVSALCDGEIIPSEAAEHVGTCEACRARLGEYLAMGVELRRVASLESALPAPPHTWQHPQNTLVTWWRKGWGTMKIPRFAFALLVVAVLVLASALTVAKVRARDTGTVVLLTTTGPNSRLMDCPLSTVDSKWATCSCFGKLGSRDFGFKVDLLSRAGDRVRLAIRTRTFSPGENLSAFTTDSDPAAKLKEVWFEPGEPLKMDFPEVGTLTLTGKWLDHIPVLVGPSEQDLSPGPHEFRFASPLLLKDGRMAGDLVGMISGVYSTDGPEAVWAYIPGQGSFLLSLLHMKGAVEARVQFSRISFKDDGHSWEFVTGTPVSRADHIWVLHQPNFKSSATAQNPDSSFVGTRSLVQAEPGVWVPKKMPN